MTTSPILSIICGFFDSGKKNIIDNVIFDDSIKFLKDIKDFYYNDVDAFNCVEESINNNRVTIIEPNVKIQHKYFNLNVTNADKRLLFVFRHPGISWFINQHKLKLIENGSSYTKTLNQYVIGFRSFFSRYMDGFKSVGFDKVCFENLLQKETSIRRLSKHIGVSMNSLNTNCNEYFTINELDKIESSINLISQEDLNIIYDELSEYMDHFNYKKLSLDDILYMFSQLMGYDSIISCLGSIKKSIGLDLDGTIAEYNGWKGISYIGNPIQPIIDAALEKEKEGYEIIILTARAADPRSIPIIKNWLRNHNLPNWRITDRKDSSMKEIWDDLAKTVKFNEGTFLHV